ncbi:MAG: hypothetical protein ACREC6_15190, partial [Hyphomicrobiaceae bacterium]
RQADQFIDLADLEEAICRDPATRPARMDRTGPVVGERPDHREHRSPVRREPPQRMEPAQFRGSEPGGEQND